MSKHTKIDMDRLLAAAPDLLEALKDALWYVGLSTGAGATGWHPDRSSDPDWFNADAHEERCNAEVLAVRLAAAIERAEGEA